MVIIFYHKYVKQQIVNRLIMTFLKILHIRDNHNKGYWQVLVSNF